MQIRGDSSFCSPSEKGASTTGREQKLTWCPQCERPPRLFVCDFLKLRKLPPAPFFSNLHLKDTVFFSTSEMRVFCVKLQSGVNKGAEEDEDCSLQQNVCLPCQCALKLENDAISAHCTARTNTVCDGDAVS